MDARDDAQEIFKALHDGTGGWTLPILSDSISTCDATTDWTGTALSNDTSDKKEGTGSLKDDVATPVIDTSYITAHNPSGSWDWSAKKHILVWLKCDRANTDFTSAEFLIYEGVNWRYWNLTFSAGEWTAFKLLLPTGDGESVIPPDLTLIDSVQIKFKTADTTPFYKKIDDIRIVEKEYEAMTIEALTDPQYIGQDDKGRFEFSTNYIFRIQNL